LAGSEDVAEAHILDKRRVQVGFLTNMLQQSARGPARKGSLERRGRKSVHTVRRAMRRSSTVVSFNPPFLALVRAVLAAKVIT
jgi:hypothetical protein